MAILKRRVNDTWETVATATEFPVPVPVQITEVQANLTTLTATESGTYEPEPPYNGFNRVIVNASGGGLSYMGYDESTSTSYVETDVKMTIPSSGNYKVSWCGCRDTTSGTSGSQLYITRDGRATAYGTAQTTFIRSYFQNVVLNNVPLEAGDIITVRARARSSSYHVMVGNLIAEKV